MNPARPSRGFPLRILLPLVLCVPGFLAGCDSGTARTGAVGTKRITVAVTPWPASVALYLARENGYFRDEGLDATLDVHPSGHLGLGALLSGKADFAALGETPIARAALEGRPFAVVATVAEIDRAIVIVARKDRGIARADDLAGKRVGLVKGTTAEFFLDLYLTTSHVEPTNVRIVGVAPDEIVGALLQGEVDAVSTWEPHASALRNRLGANGTVLHEPGLYIMTWNLVASKELTQRDPDLVARFLRAIVRANRRVAERPAEARALAARECGMEVATLEREWRTFRLSVRLDQTLLLNLEDQARWMIRQGIGGGGGTPNFEEITYTKGLKAVEPGAVRIVSE